MTYQQQNIDEKLKYLRYLLTLFHNEYKFLLNLIFLVIKNDNSTDAIISTINTRINQLSEYSHHSESLYNDYYDQSKELQHTKNILKNKLYKLL